MDSTHSESLAANLVNLIGAKHIPLEKLDGETIRVGGSARGRFVFDDD